MKHSTDPLTVRLHAWQVTPPEDPDFRQRVWQRLGPPPGTTWPAYLRAHSASWALATALVLGAAAFTGSALARSHTRLDRETMVTTYLADLDPRTQAGLRP